ncbi:helix-turn-helix domain-containing protein [Aliamphritea hakodatensis]|uniref:helix-turn-helix domain-containing protein n=1 Tax=Aliamphritea hakodatensis TaxID=2895352 RepID=UPI0022FD3AB0|nr:AraC family transcriptional regulator [Aliamphritea hakodatensis]
MESWSQHRERYIGRLKAFGSDRDVIISNTSGSTVVAHVNVNGVEVEHADGRGAALAYTVLCLCTAGGGATLRKNDQCSLNDVWKPGRAGLILPGRAAVGYTPQMQSLTIAFDISEVPAFEGYKLTADDLHRVQGQLFDDELVASVMRALLHDAQVNGTFSSFFNHGLSLVIHRLLTLSKASGREAATRNLQDDPLASVLNMIDERLDEDLHVNELAASVDMEPITFTRLFKRQNGCTPYRYLTIRRMERAKVLLNAKVSVTETSLAVGYANPAKFASAFRRSTGVPPSEWKKRPDVCEFNASLRQSVS